MTLKNNLESKKQTVEENILYLYKSHKQTKLNNTYFLEIHAYLVKLIASKYHKNSYDCVPLTGKGRFMAGQMKDFQDSGNTLSLNLD